ncbi:MAG: SHOCT domain-containing protein [Candidatus Dormibacteraeota bacterium]|nr:SHOCT domain-containing protein [Candidatus Dormibacteraeota bacterium]
MMEGTPRPPGPPSLPPAPQPSAPQPPGPQTQWPPPVSRWHPAWIIAVVAAAFFLALGVVPGIVRTLFLGFGAVPAYPVGPRGRFLAPGATPANNTMQTLFGIGFVSAIGLGVLLMLAAGLLWYVSRKRRQLAASTDPLEILKLRFARGEIDQQQYESMRGILAP